MSDPRFRFFSEYRFEALLVALLGLGLLGVGYAWGGTIGTSFRERFERQAKRSREARASCDRELGRLPLTPHSTREAYRLYFPRRLLANLAI